MIRIQTTRFKIKYNNNHPYLFNNIDDQLQMLRKVIKNKIKTFDYQTKHKLTLNNHINTIHYLFKKLGTPTKTKVFDSIKKQNSKNEIKKYLSKHKEIDLHNFKNFVFKLGYASQSFPNGKLKIILNELNYDYNINLDKFQKMNYE